MSLSAEELLSQTLNKQALVSFITSHPSELSEVVRIAQTTTLPQCWRACWMLFHYSEPNDSRLKPFVNELISAIENKSDGHQRELIKLVSKMELDDDQEGAMFDQCMGVWESVKKIPSVRMMAFRFIMKVLQKYPELVNEVKYIAQDHYVETLSPGVKASVSRQIEKILK